MTSQTAVSTPAGPGQAPAPNPILSFVPMVVVILILYMLIIRPQQKQAKEHAKTLNNIKVGDRVITQGGIHGVVSALKGAVIQLKIAENVRVDVSRTAISQVVQDAPVTGNPVTPLEVK